MKKIVWILSIFLFSTVTIQAENNTTEQKLFEQNYQLQQQKEQIKELEEKLRKYTDDKIEDSNKRVEIINGSVSRYTSALTWFGIIIALIGTLVTILLVGIAWSSRQNAILEAKNTSQKETKEFLNDFKQLAETKLNEKLNDFESKADEQFKVFEKKYEAELKIIRSKVKTTSEKQDVEILFNKAYRLGQENKNEEAIKTYDELINKYKNSKIDGVQETVILSMFNKGVVFAEIDKNKDAIKSYDGLIAKIQDLKIQNIQNLVFMAMYNKGGAFAKNGKSEDAIKVYDELIAKFKDSKIDDAQKYVTMAITNKYELLIIEDQALSGEDKEWIKNTNFKLRDKASFKMLEIIDNAKKISQDTEVAEWLETYKDIKSKAWSFNELKEWINSSSYGEDVKSRINSYIDTFEKHLHRD